MVLRKLLAILVLVNFCGLTSGVKTTKGGTCALPFIYDGEVYWSCTTKNHNRPWCSTTPNYDKNKMWGNCAGMTSDVVTESAGYCVFPFTYKGVVYRSCTTANYDRPWCSTTANYDFDSKWGNCAGFFSGVRTTSGSHCAFPFIYKGQLYNTCTKEDRTRLWCSTTTNYDKDRKLGNCA